MFRTQQNAFDDAVAKATDENLTSENWEYILDVCDRASSEDTGAKDVVAAMIKRLAHRNANVQLYTLELANALSQNCGSKVHRELASRSFTDALLRLANDRNSHQQVKAKILERMAEWATMFAKDPDLGIMNDAYMRLKTQNPNLHPPSKPTKSQITDVDRQKEEEELQMALELSVKDRTASTSSASHAPPASASASSAAQPAQAPQPPLSGTTAATVSRVRALFDFQPSEPGELQFKKGDIIAVLESVYKDWWKGSLRGQTGIFPLNYVEKLSDPTQEELQREAQMEAEVFSEIKNVEKLLALLSTSSSELNVQDNEEITTLYHSTLAIRPKLIELIGKYSQRKDDFTQLNEKFIKARRDYESLLEASMSQPPQMGYPRPSDPQYGYNGPAYPPPVPHAQQAPGRYYTPVPQGNQTPQPQYPPQNGPAPFHIAGQIAPPQLASQQLPPHQQYNHQDPRNRTPSGSHPPQADPYSHRPQSTYEHPQELGTYTSPTEGRPQSYPPQFPPQSQQPGQQAPLEYPQAAPYPPDNGPSLHTQPPHQAPPQAYPPTQPQYDAPLPSQPSYQAPSAPSPIEQNPYPVLNSGPPQTGYQAYQPPKTIQHQPDYGVGAGASNPNDFYR